MAHVTNRIITRGMGPSRGKAGRAGLVTQGYTGIITQFLVDTAETVRRVYGSARHTTVKKIDEIVIYAKLVRVNGKRVNLGIEGMIRVPAGLVSRAFVSLAESVGSRIVKLVSVFARRIK